MSHDSDIAVEWREAKEHKKKLRAKYGVKCPRCIAERPRADPSVLLPGARCKVHYYHDPRPRLTQAQHAEMDNELEA
jgi:hypothetical protein